MGNFLYNIGNLSVDMATAIISCHGLPVDDKVVKVATPVVKFLVKTGFDKIIKDFTERQLSQMQKEKLSEVCETAIYTFYKLADKNGWEDNHSESYAYTRNYIESIDDAFIKAINESQKTKRVVLGTYLGGILYHQNTTTPNWDNIFYISSIIEHLTFRQLCLVFLIGNNFEEINPKKELLCVTNKVVISELSELRNQGFWNPLFGSLGGPQEYPIPLAYMFPTGITKEINIIGLALDELKDDYSNVIKSLDIQSYNPSDFPDGFDMTFDKALKKNNIQYEKVQ